MHVAAHVVPTGEGIAVGGIVARRGDLLIEVVGNVPIVVRGEGHARSFPIEQPLSACAEIPGVERFPPSEQIAPKSVDLVIGDNRQIGRQVRGDTARGVCVRTPSIVAAVTQR